MANATTERKEPKERIKILDTNDKNKLNLVYSVC